MLSSVDAAVEDIIHHLVEKDGYRLIAKGNNVLILLEPYYEDEEIIIKVNRISRFNKELANVVDNTKEIGETSKQVENSEAEVVGVTS